MIFSVPNDILVSNLKKPVPVYYSTLTNAMKNCLKNKIFPDILKNAQITSCRMKDDTGDEENYRTVSTMSHLPYVLERLIHLPLNNYTEPTFSRFQNTLLKLIEFWKTQLHTFLNRSSL